MQQRNKATCLSKLTSNNMKTLVALSSMVVYSLAAYVAPYTVNGITYQPITNHVGAPIPSHNYIGAPALYAGPAIASPLSVALRTQYHAMDELGQGTYGHSEPYQAHAAIQDGAGNRIGSFSYVTPEGQIVRTDYIADGGGFRVASNALPVGPSGPLPTPPEPVTDTPEVAAARSAHLAEYKAIQSRSKRDLVVPLAVYRKATLTKVVNNPGHAVSYRVE